jgi:hypothetical protein
VPRSAWAPDLLPTGPVPDEPDVRFLLVHHSVSPNDYDADGAVELLRGIYRFHTSADRGWPDIAYNFFVDRFGTVFEGRTGSIAGPKAADATGGSQGFAQLCCFLGDHRVDPPSAAAFDAMVGLLGWLAGRSGLDLAPGATATFVSRGSNLHPEGTTVTTPTVSGHRDMSRTACPGDAAYASIADGSLAAAASAAVGGPVAQPTTTTAAAATTAPAAPTPSTPAPSTTTTLATTAVPPVGGGSDRPAALAFGAGALAVVFGALLALRRRRRSL